jgi:hypothetical protein
VAYHTRPMIYAFLFVSADITRILNNNLVMNGPRTGGMMYLVAGTTFGIHFLPRFWPRKMIKCFVQSVIAADGSFRVIRRMLHL